jgi:hypothetical protein
MDTKINLSHVIQQKSFQRGVQISIKEKPLSSTDGKGFSN